MGSHGWVSDNMTWTHSKRAGIFVPVRFGQTEKMIAVHGRESDELIGSVAKEPYNVLRQNNISERKQGRKPLTIVVSFWMLVAEPCSLLYLMPHSCGHSSRMQGLDITRARWSIMWQNDGRCPRRWTDEVHPGTFPMGWWIASGPRIQSPLLITVNRSCFGLLLSCACLFGKPWCDLSSILRKLSMLFYGNCPGVQQININEAGLAGMWLLEAHWCFCLQKSAWISHFWSLNILWKWCKNICTVEKEVIFAGGQVIAFNISISSSGIETVSMSC